MQVNLDGVPLIAGGLLEIHAIGQRLPFDLLEKDAGAESAPARSLLHLWEEHACIPEPQSFTGEMSVGREVMRKISLDVQGMPSNRTEPYRKEILRQGLRTQEQHGHPAPGHQAQRHLETACPVDPHAGRISIDPLPNESDRGGRVLLVAR